jgi:uncharacterized damage-inducible protein DinB
MTSHYRMFAAYNAWANERLYDKAATLSDADYRADRGAFFKSVHGTLNHLLVGDRVWMQRFDEQGEIPRSLDVILYDFASLRAARIAEDARITRYIEELTEADLGKRIRYRAMSNPAEVEQDLAPALAHFFNHQTHHRGQAHCLFTQITGTAPSFDMVVLQRETGIGGMKKLG